ncbi:hypothetical protein TNIN_348191 [Trichonephila inaurata madagascariensis]|uniref:Uncharacterized protein n=1 Tax=Trichonephila inaurata madagascariensis TaxID=2747483 RepID=A0A8X6X0B0_9ARAC|nr:hypothetical protein TNIN_348191 [Trichonephila inaurata madagascariensis]
MCFSLIEAIKSTSTDGLLQSGFCFDAIVQGRSGFLLCWVTRAEQLTLPWLPLPLDKDYEEFIKMEERRESEFEFRTDSVFDAPITQDELAYALRSHPCGKSPGGDGIHSEFLRLYWP